jgi:(S)-2-hydroxyglutarate dehydrogenase
MRVAIVGGGVVGLATAYKLLEAKPNWTVFTLEKESGVGRHQSGHNSGVLHAGLYYRPGSYKARLAVSGIRAMTEYARKRGIAHEICGKLVVATNDSEVQRLHQLEERGRQNGLTGVRWLSGPEIHQIEPHCVGLAALHVPEEGIIDYGAVCRSLADDISNRGGQIQTGFEVSTIAESGSEWVITNGEKEITADFLITCAGLQSDRVAALAGGRSEVRIVPFRGEYFKLRPGARHLVTNLIYPVPDAHFPFLGVHFTRQVTGDIEAGPNAVLAFSREGYGRMDVSGHDLWDALSYPGLWRFLWRHWQMCVDEIRRSLSRHLFADSLRRMVPELLDEDLEPGGSGVRAQAMTADGNLVQDFAFVRRPRALHVINAPSPAATASLAIADEIARMVGASD